ncbi:MAG: hypothetical protein E6248_10700 [Clostridium sp.]|nr:hypothetical protein [Clostridium sp.]
MTKDFDMNGIDNFVILGEINGNFYGQGCKIIFNLKNIFKLM